MYTIALNGNEKRKSKKKTLSDYNLYLREQSSQSEDNVDTESLLSLKDDSCNKIDDSFECLFKPLPSSNVNQQNQSCKFDLYLGKNQDDLQEASCDENKIEVLTRLAKAEYCIVKSKENGETGGQVFSTKQDIDKMKTEDLFEKEREGEQEEQTSKRLRSNSQDQSTSVLSFLNIDKRKQSRSKTFNGGSLKKKKTKKMLKMKNDKTVSNHDWSESRKPESNEDVIDALSNNGVKRRCSTFSNASSTVSGEMYTPIRVDQFNKVSPSPFSNAPGFQRTYSVSYKSKSTDPFSPKLSKSTSLDTAVRYSSPSTLVGREKWIRFEEENQQNISEKDSENKWVTFPSSVSTKEEKQERELLSPTVNEYVSNDVNEKIIKTEGIQQNEKDSERKLNKTNLLNKSIDNLAEVVNKTVSLLKGSMTSSIPNEEEDEDALVSSLRERSSSEITDEIISLEFDTDEEKLRDTPVKQFPDVSLFQASIIGTDRNDLKVVRNNSINQQKSGNKTDNDRNNVLDDYPPTVIRNSWKFWFRYPDKKKRLGTRKWIPVIVHVENDFLKINSLNGNTPEIKKEIPLHPFYNFTVPFLHKGNKDGRVHSVKLQYVKYKEKRRIKPRIGFEHVPSYTPVVKLSCRDIVALREFMTRVESIIRHIPTHRDKGISYDQEEIFIDSEDECTYLIASDGHILKYNISVQLRLRCFITGNPEIKLFLNDLNNRELLSRTKEALARDNGKTLTNWINPELYEYNACVDANKSTEEGGIVFTPPDGCSFELLRFRLRKRNPLPIVVTTSLEVLALSSVHLKAELKVNGDAKNIRHKRHNVILYIPVPSSWSKLFLKSNLVGRTSRYLNVKSSLKSNQPAKANNTRVTFEISAGSACYEPAYGAIIWELGTLPIIKDGLAADARHNFRCSIELPFPIHIRDDFQPYSYLEYNVKNQMGSNVSVEELLLSDGRVPEKWVCYRASYMHKVEMRILEDGKERKKSEDIS